MDRPALWLVALAVPGEREIALLADISRRPDCRIIGVVDPTGEAVGTAIAEVMGIPIFATADAAPLSEAHYLIHPIARQGLEAILSAADRQGLVPVSSDDFERLLAPAPLRVTTARPASPQSDRLERETEAIHRTLSRIEEVLHRESLLRWLLSLATRAVQATAGSIMLYDEKSRELYIAFAHGLSEATVHRTRLRLGQGIAGRVAEQLRAELVRSRPGDSGPRDRPDIASAISAPLIHGGRLLGVLNVNAAVGDRALDDDNLATIDRLARRISLILHRFLGIQQARDGELFLETDRTLQAAMVEHDDLGAILTSWVELLARRVVASRLSLALLCEDGSCLCAETSESPAAGAPAAVSLAHVPAENPAWLEVVQTGAPMVVREVTTDASTQSGWTVFYLPVGKAPVQAILTAGYAAPAAAHRFHDLSGEIVYLLEKRLPELVSRFVQRDRLERFTALTHALTDIAAAASDEQANPLALLATAARQLTGAGGATIVRGLSNGHAHLVDEVAEPSPLLPRAASDATPPVWAAQAARLLGDAAPDGWRITALDRNGQPGDVTLLAVTAARGTPAPGLILHDKQRLHPLDGALFSAFDAELAGRLARLLPGLLRLNAEAEPQPAILAVVDDPGSGGPRRPAAPDGRDPTDRLVGRSAGAPSAILSGQVEVEQEELLLGVLRREMDRCDRYHTAFALTALRPAPPTTWDAATARHIAETLGERVRSSDFVTYLADGTVLLLAPEETQAVSRLARRLGGLLRELTADEKLNLLIGHCVYPSRHESPRGLLEATLHGLLPPA